MKEFRKVFSRIALCILGTLFLFAPISDVLATDPCDCGCGSGCCCCEDIQYVCFPIETGGTAATNVVDARTNLGVYSKAEIDSALTNYLKTIYPVGAIYMSTSSINPGTLFGGTWAAWGQGRVPVGMGSNGTTNYTTVQSTGGSERHYHGWRIGAHWYYGVMVRPEGFEPPTFRIGICCDIQLRYGQIISLCRIITIVVKDKPVPKFCWWHKDKFILSFL